MDKDEKLYTETEIVQMVKGLMIVYYQKSWLGRLFYKPFLIALETLQFQLIGEKLVMAKEAREASEYYQSLLDEE